MTKKQIKTQTKKYIFIGLVAIALVFVLFQFRKGGEFRIAKKAFNSGNYAEAAELFSQLGTYSDSDRFVIYCKALDAFGQEDYEASLELFESLGTFQKSTKYALYTQGMIAYQNSQYWEAASLFIDSGDSLLGHADFLDNETKAQMCYYASGQILEATGDYTRAITCYRLAENYEDAPERLRECEEAMKNGGNISGDHVG